MSYKAKYPLFRNLTETEVRQFKESVYDLCKNGFSINEIEVFHPIVRKELIRLITESLKKQNEL